MDNFFENIDRQIDIQIDRQIERQKDRQIDRQIDRICIDRICIYRKIDKYRQIDKQIDRISIYIKIDRQIDKQIVRQIDTQIDIKNMNIKIYRSRILRLGCNLLKTMIDTKQSLLTNFSHTHNYTHTQLKDKISFRNWGITGVCLQVQQ